MNNQKLKYFIPILGVYYCLKDMPNTINLFTPGLYFGTAAYHGVTLVLMIFSLLP